MEKGAAKPLHLPRKGLLPPPHQEPPSVRSALVGRPYVMSMEEASTSGIIVTGTLILDSSAAYLFISTSCFTIEFREYESRIQL